MLSNSIIVSAEPSSPLQGVPTSRSVQLFVSRMPRNLILHDVLVMTAALIALNLCVGIASFEAPVEPQLKLNFKFQIFSSHSELKPQQKLFDSQSLCLSVGSLAIGRFKHLH